MKKKIVLIILLLIFLIIQIISFTNSRANKIITIKAQIEDGDGILEIETIELNAANENNEGYSIVLPERINGKKVLEYELQVEQVDGKPSNNVEEKNLILNNTNEINEIVNNTEEDNIQVLSSDTSIAGDMNDENSILVKMPGDKIALSQEEINSSEIHIRAFYDTKTVDNKILYNKILEKEQNGRNIKLEGYMPSDSTIQVEEVSYEQIQTELDEFLSNTVNLKIAYDITIWSDGKEYNPSEYDEQIEVTITNIEESEETEEKEYRVVHIEEENSAEVESVEKEEKNLVFSADNFSVYAVLEEVAISELATYASVSSIGANADVWEGDVANSFQFGNGSQQSPYLIATGAELAYLAERVNNGENFQNQYFQLANDINLDDREWTPIGDTSNSFRGVFDGAGHVIANGRINVSSLPNRNVESYGLFGSLGGGTSTSIIRNLEINNIIVSIGGSGNASNGGWHIGTLVGTMYRNSEVINNIANNCSISDNGNVTVYNSAFQYSVGGLVGYATNTSSSTSDPGQNNRYRIENCFVNTEINLTNDVRTSWFGTSTYDAQYHTGGIIGTIRSQAVWPEESLYVGSINSNGFIGPIFGALLNSTSYNRRSNFAVLWNGNDAGNLSMTSYYSGFSANGTTFTTSITSGTSSSRLSSDSDDIGYVQGVNKGIYVSDISTRLTNFNNYAGNEYIKWKYKNGTFSFIKRFATSLDDTNLPIYKVIVDNEYSNGPYTYEWYLEGNLVEELENQNQVEQELPDNEILHYTVLVGDGEYYSILNFTIERLYIEFNINENNNSVTASIRGAALQFINIEDYEFQWYALDAAGLNDGKIEGATSLTLNNLEKGIEYKLVATYTPNYSYSIEDSFIYGDRTVVYVNYSGGNDNNDGFTPETAVRTMQTAYSKLSSNVDRNENIIVIMGTYSSNSFFNYADTSNNSSAYRKNATLTGIYAGIDYEGELYFYSGTGSYRYLNGDTTFQYLDFNGRSNQMYLYAQGYSLTMGEGITMNNFANSNQNQGLLGGNAPAFHLICGWCQYNYTTLPRNNPKIVINSGTYARIIGGGSPGTSDGQGQEDSHDFTGSSREDTFNIEITIDIENSTTASRYDYDVNLLTGGSACGNNYSNVTENIYSGSVGRVLGGSIGDSQVIPTTGSWWNPQPWEYPNNTFLGETTINVEGGTINELYGGCLGRNMGAIDNSGNVDSGYTGYTCDSYFYGTININITGGTITNNIYGAGAGGVTGYSQNSSDPYKSYGADFDTSVNISISGGTINGNVYGGGYGYTEYLNANVTAEDGGSLYGDSNIEISGSPTINGDIYAAGCGYDMSNRPNLAQMEGDSNITISGAPTINGQIFAAGAGLSNYSEMAKLTGNTKTTINSNVSADIYGGGNNAKTEGTTTINIESGTHTGDIYGGGNLGTVEGTSNVNVNGGSNNRVFGGGNQASVTTSNIYINGGTTNEIYAGGNSASVTTTNTYINGGQTNTLYGGSNQTGTVQNSNIEGTSGTVGTLYGGNNVGGITQNSTVTIDGSSITEAIYGGGNQVDTTNANVYLLSSGNNIPYIFGGGNQAAVGTPNVYIQGGQAQNVFGGSNANGTINQSNVEVTGGEIENVYGGNNQGGTTITTSVKINGGKILTAVYGGGDQAQSETSNIELIKSEEIIPSVYGGGNEAGVTTTNVNLNGADVGNLYGGSNTSGEVTNSYVITNLGTAENVYGGNNQGGTTNTTNVSIMAGEIVNVYGGGNNAITNETNLTINGTVTGDVYGGGNEAGVNTNTNLNIENAQINNNVYGGGNNGIVSQNTFVHIKNANLGQSLYSGGNGATAIVYGNTNLTIEGVNTIISGNVFGGGNKAATGSNDSRTSVSTVNIVSGEIGGNVYGGANRSVVYGVTNTNIGYDVVGNTSLEKGNIHIVGTVFGGGEANESGSEVYDFSFISVTNGIDINIDANGYNEFDIDGSIFGSGNASSTSGESYININNYGTADEPKSNVSIQRANCATITNSAIALSGATDRTNEYSDEYYTISRVDNVKLQNNSTLYLNYGANLLIELDSILYENGQEIKGAVTINEEDGTVTKNVDNRIYMAEGRNLNIATNEQVSTFGQVHGMFFFGLFTNRMNPSTSTGLYNHNYQNGDEITNEGTFSSNSYARAQHMDNHDTSIDGFYTNYNEEGNIKMKYIETTPADDVYYIWLVGEQMDVTTFEFSLSASKYATLGTHELSLMGFSDPNIVFSLIGFSAGLDQDISLVDPDEIEPIAQNEEDANNIYGLTMESGNTGWQNQGSTTFLTERGGTYEGSSTYTADNSTFTPTLNFCLYHSANITEEKLLGDVRIRLQALVPADDLNFDVLYIDINITLTTALYQDDYYEAAITPGEEYGLFTSTSTSITKKSAFSTYYSLYLNEFSNSEYYNDFVNDYRVLISRDSNNMEYCFPENTRIVMLDLVTDKEYYYVVTAEDVQNNKFEYRLSDFIAMGSTDEYFEEDKAFENYYNENQDILYENFVFHVKFSEANITNDIENNNLLMELRNKDDETLIGVLGIQRDIMQYNVYSDKESTIEVSGVIDSTAYIGSVINLDVTTDFKQQIVNSMTIYDTEYFENKMGIMITIYDSNDNQISLDSLFGVNFELDGERYYPRLDGTTRIKIADNVSNVLSKIKIDTTNNSTWATGTYTIKIETFGSPDGIYFGLDSSASTELTITIINSSYGLNLYTDDEAKIIDHETGQDLDGNTSIQAYLEYSSGLENPRIVAALYRRKYDEVYSNEYELVNLKDYFVNTVTQTDIRNEYLITRNPMSFSNINWELKDNLKTGTYKLVYKLYDSNNYIGEDYEYFIIK